MLLVSVELVIMLFILLFVPGDSAGPCFIGFAIGESLGAAALRIAGGIFTKIADIGSDLMKIVFKIKEDDARNPGVIADCTGDNAGDSVGPTADGFETYGVTGVALITFIILAVKDPTVQIQLLVWIFVMRIGMIVTSAASYYLNGAWAKAKFANAPKFNFEIPLTTLVWLTSIVSIVMTYALSAVLIPTLGGDSTLWWKLSTIITCGTIAGALIPSWSRSSPRRTRAMCARSSRPPRRGRLSQHPERHRGRLFQRLLDGPGDHCPHGHRLCREHRRAWRPHGGSRDLRLRPRRLRLPGHGSGDDRRRLLRPGHRQRPVRLRALHHRDDPSIKEDIRAQFGFTPISRTPRPTWRRTTARGTPSRPRPNPCSSHRRVGATTLIFSIIQLLTKMFGEADVSTGLSILNPSSCWGSSPVARSFSGSPAPPPRPSPPAPTGP